MKKRAVNDRPYKKSKYYDEVNLFLCESVLSVLPIR